MSTEERRQSARGNPRVQRTKKQKRAVAAGQAEQTDPKLPEGFILLSEASHRLQKSMWAGQPDPDALRNAKASSKEESKDPVVTIETEMIRKTFGQEG